MAVGADSSSAPRRSREQRLAIWAAVVPVVTSFLAIGLLGLYRYANNYWLYRGFSPPHDPAWVKQQGTQQIISIKSAAIGGRSQQTYVYLPPGYAQHPKKRYPVIYLLHGYPGGQPNAFMLTARVGVVEDTLVAQGLMKPVIIVMPHGSTGIFSDEEWVNGTRPNQGWETFVARDVVRKIDARYRTIRSGRARAIGGLSAGGYGAINIAFHHPREFHVIESWSGYELAQHVPRVFGGDARLIAHNSPGRFLHKAARKLRLAHTFVWLYSGNQDPLRFQNQAFSAELAHYRIAHQFFMVGGGHTWRVWRSNAREALLVAAGRLRHA